MAMYFTREVYNEVEIEVSDESVADYIVAEFTNEGIVDFSIDLLERCGDRAITKLALNRLVDLYREQIKHISRYENNDEDEINKIMEEFKIEI